MPAFYDRDAAGVPHRWLQVVKQSIRTVLPRFSARRMVKEYAREMYGPALQIPVGASRRLALRRAAGAMEGNRDRPVVASSPLTRLG